MGRKLQRSVLATAVVAMSLAIPALRNSAEKYVADAQFGWHVAQNLHDLQAQASSERQENMADAAAAGNGKWVLRAAVNVLRPNQRFHASRMSSMCE